MKVYFVRHGSSAANEGDIHQGEDDPLSEAGRRQAHAVANRLAGLPIDLIVASPFARARDTAQIIAGRLDRPIHFDDLLVEKRNPPEIVGLHFHDPAAVAVKARIAANVELRDWRYSTEENFWDVRRRAGGFLHHLDRYHCDHLLVVTHGYFLKLLLCVMMLGDGLTYTAFHAFERFTVLTNTGITVCERRPGEPWQLLTLNDRAHLD